LKALLPLSSNFNARTDTFNTLVLYVIIGSSPSSHQDFAHMFYTPPDLCMENFTYAGRGLLSSFTLDPPEIFFENPETPLFQASLSANKLKNTL